MNISDFMEIVHECRAQIIVFCAIMLLSLSLWLINSYCEASTYARLTGAKVTMWDAMWLELRVQDAPRKDGVE